MIWPLLGTLSFFTLAAQLSARIFVKKISNDSPLRGTYNKDALLIWDKDLERVKERANGGLNPRPLDHLSDHRGP